MEIQLELPWDRTIVDRHDRSIDPGNDLLSIDLNRFFQQRTPCSQSVISSTRVWINIRHMTMDKAVHSHDRSRRCWTWGIPPIVDGSLATFEKRNSQQDYHPLSTL